MHKKVNTIEELKELYPKLTVSKIEPVIKLMKNGKLSKWDDFEEYSYKNKTHNWNQSTWYAFKYLWTLNDSTYKKNFFDQIPEEYILSMYKNGIFDRDFIIDEFIDKYIKGLPKEDRALEQEILFRIYEKYEHAFNALSYHNIDY